MPHPGLIIAGLAIAWAVSQGKEPKAPAAAPEVDKDPTPKAGGSTESSDANGVTKVVDTVDGTAEIKPTTDKASAGSMADAAQRGFAAGSGTRTSVQTAPGPAARGAAAGVGMTVAGAALGAVSPFAGLGARAATGAASAGLATSTVSNTSRKQAVRALESIGPSLGAIW